MKNNYFLLFGLFLAANAIRTIYEILKKHGVINPKNRLLFALIFLDMMILWISWFAMCPLDPVHFGLSSIIKCFGLGATILGVVLAVGGLIQLKGLENISHLVATGLYSRLRHPMYTGFILWILGWGIYHDAMVSLISGIFGVGNIIYWRSLEERHLEFIFGDKYRSYKAQTWF